jgi:hypothetical protein
MTTPTITGPLWADPGLDSRGGRYPLAVEAPVMAMIGTLIPGVSTLTTLVRYFTLYWALAAFAEEHQLDTATCHTMVRRSEVALALASHAFSSEPRAHGVDRVIAILNNGDPAKLTPHARTSYSPRAWGFWSQYAGPSVALGTVTTHHGALRTGRLACPPAVRAMFQPLLRTVAERDYPVESVDAPIELAPDQTDTPDLPAFADVFTAALSSSQVSSDWTGDDRTRRETLRLATRAVQLSPAAPAWTDAMRQTLAYGDTITTDPVFTAEQTADRALAWRGVLLRHQSVGAWRSLWAALVEHVRAAKGTADRAALHEWITAELPATTVDGFLAQCPRPVGPDGHPAPAEDELLTRHRGDHGPLIVADLAILLIGGQRLEHLTGRARAAFLGYGSQSRGQFLDPRWMTYRHHEHAGRSLQELGRTVVDDMLAQSRRVALRKLQVGRDGRMTLFSRLHERNGRYFAEQPEGSGNVGLRIDQVHQLSQQLGLATTQPDRTVITPYGQRLLGLPG